MTHRILLCDDELHILRAVEFKLKRAGFTVLCAEDGGQGWEIYQAELPDMLITDLQMPVMNGFELIERVRALESDRPPIPIVMLTAKGYEMACRELADRWGIEAILAKPFSPREIVELVQSSLMAFNL
jgi:two-component system alkaline phosphatase synthesis response regulator PhoP